MFSGSLRERTARGYGEFERGHRKDAGGGGPPGNGSGETGEAFTLYDELHRQLWGLFGTVQSELAVNGGLPQRRPWELSGIQSWHVESTANIFCARAYGMSLSSTLEALAGVLRGHLLCLCSSREVSAGVTRDQVLLEFGLSYLLLETELRRRRVAPLFALVTAVVHRHYHKR